MLRILLVLAVLGVSLQGVRAQTTSIVVQHPDHARFGSSIEVVVKVSYSESSKLLFVILLDETTEEAVPGFAVSSPEPCILTKDSACAISTSPGSSGTETIRFQFVASAVKSWRLVATAAFVDADFKPVTSSISYEEFTIEVSGTVTLRISTPPSVHAIVDNVDRGTGSFDLPLQAGPHIISVPEMIQIDNTSRLKFDSWSDGETLHERTILLNSNMSLQANFANQYLLTIASPLNTTESGWYDSGTLASFSTPTTPQTMGGLAGLLGGKWQFEGWFENGTFVTSLESGSIAMFEPHSLEARWRADYSVPILIIAIIAAVLVAGYLVARRTPALRGITTTEVQPIVEQELTPVQPNVGSKHFCASCGFELPPDSEFCINCGRSVS